MREEVAVLPCPLIRKGTRAPFHRGGWLDGKKGRRVAHARLQARLASRDAVNLTHRFREVGRPARS